MNSHKMSRIICLIDIKQIIACLMSNMSSTHLCFLGMMGRPFGRASCQSPKPEGGAEGAGIDSECACQATIGLP
jgi:hypothetical protein